MNNLYEISNNDKETSEKVVSGANNQENTQIVKDQEIQPKTTNKEQEPKKGILDKLKNTKIDFSFLRKIGSKDNKSAPNT